MTLRTLTPLLATLLALSAPLTTQAAGASADALYLSAAFGLSSIDTNCGGTSICDDTATGFKLSGGYRFTPNWAVQVDYIDFGEAEGSTGSLFTSTVASSAFGVSAVYSLKLGPQLVGRARLGLASVETEISGNIAGLLSGGRSESETGLYAGLSLGYEINRQLTIEGSWDFTSGSVGSEDVNVHLFSAGLRYDF